MAARQAARIRVASVLRMRPKRPSPTSCVLSLLGARAQDYASSANRPTTASELRSS